MIYLICAALVTLIWINIIRLYIIHRNSEKNPDLEICMNSFSRQDYFDTIEKVTLDLLEEKEKEEPYQIILWWGLDGIRLNKDGTTEWISRRKPHGQNHKVVPTYDYGVHIIRTDIPCMNSCGRDISGNIVREAYKSIYSINQMQSATALQGEELSAYLQYLMGQQTQAVINSLHSCDRPYFSPNNCECRYK